MSTTTAAAPLVTLRTAFETDALHTTPWSEWVYFRSGDELRAARADDLRAAAAGNATFDAPVRTRGLTGDVTAAGDALFLIRRGLERLPTAAGPGVTIPLPALPGPLTDALPDAGAQSWLCVTQNLKDCDLPSFEVSRTTATGLLPIAQLSSALQPQIHWCAPPGAFLIFDALREQLWQLGAQERTPQAIDLSRLGERAIHAVCVSPVTGWIAVVARGQRDGQACILHGGWSGDKLIWDAQPRLEDGLLQAFRWRPGLSELVYARVENRRAEIELVDSVGARVATCTLPRGWVVNDLAWTGDGRSVVIAGHDMLAIWTPMEAV